MRGNSTRTVQYSNFSILPPTISSLNHILLRKRCWILYPNSIDFTAQYITVPWTLVDLLNTSQCHCYYGANTRSYIQNTLSLLYCTSYIKCTLENFVKDLKFCQRLDWTLPPLHRIFFEGSLSNLEVNDQRWTLYTSLMTKQQKPCIEKQAFNSTRLRWVL
jgi:hypothetical protein